MRKNCIELINVSKQYGRNNQYPIEALKDINLKIHQGEFIGIAGKNGSGKSTLVKLFNGLIFPTTGQILVNGMDTTRRDFIWEIRRHVGMVFQNPDNQIISPIVEEEIAFGPQNLGLTKSEIKDRVAWALDVVGLKELRHHAPHLLSGGQKQKLAIASALAMMPDYLVLDEPTSMLDLEGRQMVIEQLKLLNKNNGITIILISHDMEDFVYANRLIVLDEGRIYLQGSIPNVYTETEKMIKCGLKLPEILQLVINLRKRGCCIDENIIDVEKLGDVLCRLLRSET
jgi:energy-coupling factor transport system ATP-binding protein